MCNTCSYMYNHAITSCFWHKEKYNYKPVMLVNIVMNDIKKATTYFHNRRYLIRSKIWSVTTVWVIDREPPKWDESP